MSFIFLDAHLRKYHVSLNDFSTSMIKPPLSASVYAKRHFEIANMPENQGNKFRGLGHRLIGIVEYLPILGLVAGIAERIIAFVFHQAKIFLSKFKSEAGVTNSNLTANTPIANPQKVNTPTAKPELQKHVEDDKNDSAPKDSLPNEPELIPKDNRHSEPAVKDGGLQSDKVKDEPELKEMSPQPTPVTKKTILDIYSEYRLHTECIIETRMNQAVRICNEIQKDEWELIAMHRESTSSDNEIGASINNLESNIRLKKTKVSEAKEKLALVLDYGFNFKRFYQVFLPDFKITVGEKEFAVSKKLLSRASGYLKATFALDNSPKRSELKLENLKPETFEFILDYYTKTEHGNLKKLSFDQLFDIILAANYLQMDILQYESINLFLELMDADKFEMIKGYAKLAIEVDKLLPYFREFISSLNLGYLSSEEAKDLADTLSVLDHDKEINKFTSNLIR